MEVTLPLDRMSISEKLQVLEAVWDDLLRTPDEVPVPAWHRDVLEARERRVHEGVARFDEWARAKDRIRERAR